jgi:hypothetical protein
MKIQIQPKTFTMPDGDYTATVADINYTNGDAATFQNLTIQLQDANENNIGSQISVAIKGNDYTNWDNTDAAAINFVCEKINVQIKN